MTTRAEAISSAAVIFAHACFERDARSAREAAEAAWYPGHRLASVDAVEALIVEKRRAAEDAWAAGAHPLQLRQQLPHAA